MYKRQIIDKAIFALPKKGISRGRARTYHLKKKQGRHRGLGSRKGKLTARMPKKDAWKNVVRAQKALLKKLRDEKTITTRVYRELYMKVKGGFFRSVRHIKLYIEEHELKNE